MARNLLKNLLIFGTGVGVGYLLGVKLVKKEYQNDLGEVKDFYMEKLKNFGVMDQEFEPEEIPDEDEASEDTVKTTIQKVKGRPITRYDKPSLSEIADERLKEETYDDVEEDENPLDDIEESWWEHNDELMERRNLNRSKGLPYVIDFLEFEELSDSYDVVDLYYYAVDRVICDDDDEKVEVDDEEELIGLDYEDVLDEQTTAWVKNDMIMTVYEIHRIDESFNETIEFMDENDDEKELRKNNRRRMIKH